MCLVKKQRWGLDMQICTYSYSMRIKQLFFTFYRNGSVALLHKMLHVQDPKDPPLKFLFKVPQY